MLNYIKNSFEHAKKNNAFCINGKYFTYDDFQHLISGIQKTLKNNYSEKNTIVGIVCNDDIYTYASVFAVWFAGKAYVPVHPDVPVERNISIIKQSRISYLLTAKPKEVSVLVKNICQIIDTSKSINGNENILEIPESFDKNSIAYLLFTSGSTGIPKGVPITFGNLDCFVHSFFKLGYEVTENDRVLQMFDLTFDLSVMSYLIPLCKGACVYTVPSNEMKYTAIYSILEEHKITIALMVPSVISFLRKYFSDIHLPEMRYSLFCGEALLEDIAKEWSTCVPNAEIHNVYGPTEATIFCMIYPMDFTKQIKSHNGIVCIGKPMDNVYSIIIDDSGNIAKVGQTGELCLGGFQLSSGYWDDIQKTKTVFISINNNGKESIFYKTGDIAFDDEQGDFYYCGRSDNQIKIQGYRVELSEIEFHARKLLQTNNVAAIACQNETGNTIIHLFIENFKGETTTILNALKNVLPDYMIPSEIFNCPVFPLNQNGKTDKNALKKIIINNQNFSQA